MDSKLIPYYFGTAFLWILWLFEEARARGHNPLSPQALLCAAIVATGVCTIVFGRLFRAFQRLNRGERGELCVGEVLDELRSDGYRVFHDLVRDAFNVDHVVVGPAGVFVVETKFRSGRGEIEFRNGEGLFVGGRKEDNDPLKQARGCAGEINKLIKETTGQEIWVKPLVVFVGDWRIKNTWRNTDARVFTPAQVVRYVCQQQPELRRSEIQLIASHLERTARGH